MDWNGHPDGLFYIGSEISARGIPVFNIFDESTGQWTRYELPVTEALESLYVTRWNVGPERVLYGFTSNDPNDAANEVVAVPMSGPKAGTVVARTARQRSNSSSDYCILHTDGIWCPDSEGYDKLVLAWVAPDGTPLGKTVSSQSNRAWEVLLSTMAATDDDATFVQPSGQTITYRNSASAVGMSGGIAILTVASAPIAGDECALATLLARLAQA
jgi:hypothetical protein